MQKWWAAVPDPPLKRLDPPFFEPPIVDVATGQQHSHAWTDYHQQIADHINTIVAGAGITDGSDAPAGNVGEVLTASGSGVALSSGGVATVATLTLTPGDWDVTGGVVFNISGAASSHYAAGIDGVFGTEIIATIPSGSGVWRLQAGTVRRNVTASTAVVLSAAVFFSSGAVSADGTLRARRMR